MSRKKCVDNIIGMRINRLVVKEYYRGYYYCLCDCGRYVKVKRKDLLNGIYSCGCKRNNKKREEVKVCAGDFYNNLYDSVNLAFHLEGALKNRTYFIRKMKKKNIKEKNKISKEDLC